MSSLKFIWVDDEPDRKKSAKNFQDNFDNLIIDFIDVKKKKEANKVEKSTKNKLKQGKPKYFLVQLSEEVLAKSKAPDLILIDHRFDDVHHAEKINISGAAVAELIRNEWPTIPMIGVTGVDFIEISLKQKGIYDDLISIDNFSSNYFKLIAIAESYKILRKNRLKKLDEIIKLLKAPEIESVRLINAFSEDIKKNLGTDSVISAISDWVRNVLMSRTGFLCDRLAAATLLGLNEKGFEKIEKKFQKAKYKGLFAHQDNELWWRSELLSILFKNQNKNEKNWKVGRDWPSIKPEHFSKCANCKLADPAPEIVGYNDSEYGKKLQLHIHCSESDSNQENLLYFDEVRILKG